MFEKEENFQETNQYSQIKEMKALIEEEKKSVRRQEKELKILQNKNLTLAQSMSSLKEQVKPLKTKKILCINNRDPNYQLKNFRRTKVKQFKEKLKLLRFLNSSVDSKFMNKKN